MMDKELFNVCRFCGKRVLKPKVFCDDVCERAYKVKELLPELHGICIGSASKHRLAMILNIAKMLKNGRSEDQIRDSLALWFTRKTVDNYLELARKVVELEF